MISCFPDAFKIVERGEIPTWVSTSRGNVSQTQTLSVLQEEAQKSYNFDISSAVPMLL